MKTELCPPAVHMHIGRGASVLYAPYGWYNMCRRSTGLPNTRWDLDMLARTHTWVCDVGAYTSVCTHVCAVWECGV